jgi:hypothetical protein
MQHDTMASSSADLAAVSGPKVFTVPLHVVRLFLVRGKNYLRLVGWLLHRSFRGRRSTLTGLLAQSLLYLGGQWAAILLLYWYARVKQGEAPFPDGWFVGISLPAEPMLVWSVIALAAACLIGSSFFLYLSRSVVLRVVERDYGRSLVQLLHFAKRLPDPRAPVASRLYAEHHLGGLNSGCRLGALTAIHFCNAFAPIASGVAALVVLTLVDPWLTFLLLSAAASWVLLLYPLSLRAANLARRRERARHAFRLEAHEILRQPAAPVPDALQTAQDLACAYLGRRRVSNEMQFLVQIGAILIAAVAALYMAYSILSGHGDWPIFIAYLGGLRLALAGSFQAAVTFASVSRFYPEIARFFLFMESARQIDERPRANLAREEAIVLGRLPSGGDVAVGSGERIALLSDASPLELQLAFLEARSATTNMPLHTAVLQSMDEDPAGAPIVVAKPELLHEHKLLQDDRQTGPACEPPLLIVWHRDPATVGAHGETKLLVVTGQSIEAFARIGTEECVRAIRSIDDGRRSTGHDRNFDWAEDEED